MCLARCCILRAFAACQGMEIVRQALVPHSPIDMYRLVHDVESYPDFLSWCAAARVLENTPEMQLARLWVRLGGVRRSFTTRNRLVPGERLAMSLVEGPFTELNGEWTFTALGHLGSKVRLRLAFEMSDSLLSSAFRRGFAHVADRMVRDFCARADRVYAGGRPLG